jgi:hypothetical protein
METRGSPSRKTLLRSVEFQCVFIIFEFSCPHFRLAEHAKLTDAESMPKSLLFKRLTTEFDFDRLVRLEKRKSNHDTPELKRRRDRDKPKDEEEAEAKLNSLDPIMLVPIGKKKTFKFSRPNGTKVQFNVDSLIDYLLSTGDFHDPETRLQFTDENLKEIDQIVSFSCNIFTFFQVSVRGKS